MELASGFIRTRDGASALDLDGDGVIGDDESYFYDPSVDDSDQV
jgi:hypothetical protein